MKIDGEYAGSPETYSKVNFSELEGKTILSITRDEDDSEDVIVIVTADGLTYKQQHNRSCCEAVYIEDICGELQDIKNALVISAEEVTNDEPKPEGADEAFLWTFYKLRTTKGDLTIRWRGESNGYYGVDVDFIRLTPGTIMTK